MVAVKTVKKNKSFCHDCKKKIEKEKKEIKNGMLLEYENQGEKILVFKCKNCFKKNQELRNYQPCEVYSRIVGYLRPIQQWNKGKTQEFKERKEYKLSKKHC
jgi:anaerobic ribonucleoside-triphosphate reductase